MAQRNLREAINVDGAELIGSAKGYDLFDIITYEAAQQFVNARTEAYAGADWTQNASTFNNNIGENLHLYFFVQENTNRVQYGLIKGRNTNNQSLVINNTKNNHIDITVNFSLENTNHEPVVAAGDPVPLFLLPDIDIEEAIGRDGVYFSDDTLVAVLPQFCNVDAVQIDHIPHHIKFIKDDAFYYGQRVSFLLLSDNLENLGANLISDDVFEVHIDSILEAPDNWNSNWNANHEDITFFGYGLSDEDRAEIEAQIAERERQAEEARRAEEERIEAERRAEQERVEREARLAAEREARKIRYRVEGDHIVIKGTRMGIKELEIPPEIDGKPVTKIESYAFYDNQDLVKVTLPQSIKLIERGAFLRLPNLNSYVKVSRDCIVGKDNPLVRKR